MEDKQTNLNCLKGTKRLKRSFLGNPKMLSQCGDPDIKCKTDKGRGNPIRWSQKVILRFSFQTLNFSCQQCGRNKRSKTQKTGHGEIFKVTHLMTGSIESEVLTLINLPNLSSKMIRFKRFHFALTCSLTQKPKLKF